jgi:hypothetical protein
MERREYFTSACTLVAIFTTGCSGLLTNSDPDGEVRPESEPEQVSSEIQCNDENTKRLSKSYEEEVEWGDNNGFSLRVDSLSYSYGDRAKVTLTNTSSGTQETGSNMKYSIERYTEDGWEDIRVEVKENENSSFGNIFWPDDARNHDPGDGFEWELTLTEGELRIPNTFSDIIRVCPELESGRYRFVYWGLSNPIAVAFDLYRDG